MEEEVRLIDSLKNGYPQQEIEPAHSLGEAGSHEAIPTLIKGLGDGIKDVRVECIWALRQLSEASTKPLARALKSQDILC